MSLAPVRPDLAGKRLVLALSGGIACYKAAELCRLLVRSGAELRVVMSDGAQRFITPTTLQALSGRPVVTSQWDASGEANAMPHINLTRGADAIVLAPASAEMIARLAQGRSDEIVSLTCLARPLATGHGLVPLLVAPAMNREMWAHPATQRNVAQLRADGALVLGPDAGDQACGEIGDGRMLEPEALLEDIVAALSLKPLAGRSVLITAGPTFEAIDPVRGLTNRSSGKMGFALARAAREAGATVTLVAGPVHLDTPRGVARVDVQSAQQMQDAVLARAAAHELFIATAAVADWRPLQLAEHKIKKNGKKQPPALELTENADILAAVAALPRPPFCVGFAAESENLAAHAREKLVRKKLPLVVGNLGPATFGRDDNALLLVDADGEQSLPADGSQADKLTLARALVAEIARRLAVAR
ncbi:bifunctional phosphopantothenoylcysteine decarboxylase/phosphopantothenate--cysteine ligase CoaBC [Rivibacter subsaxonicus]|uniref:Coenzyme A biosynthesis bifunctional protein CoaBC n=1 Tax=Rivibacter subsaxonicus TaxID=457575 RepID=A0A4Q7VNY0_9BURK|nr:bifunctional phosphopantothenoylcysteine decarboxylase/phosphopantothenate--cysteine ligase CoaBC [Rivibacter subsaxonicus]RZT97877.1 phosphopantothenoylcysteine decarboxylase/phosphopantothenate--cysteine ligase [Rivibacter subsaxonicus]